MFKIGWGWKDGESIHIILSLSEYEIRKLLMLAPYEFAPFPVAILRVDRVAPFPEEQSSMGEVTFAVRSIQF